VGGILTKRSNVVIGATKEGDEEDEDVGVSNKGNEEPSKNSLDVRECHLYFSASVYNRLPLKLFDF